MKEITVAGQVVGGKFGSIIIRQKSGCALEIGDLLTSAEEDDYFLILQVFALEYGSQIQDSMRQMISGVSMEQGAVNARFYEPDFVNYILASVKPLAKVHSVTHDVVIPKSLPQFFGKMKQVSKDDLEFLQKEKDSIFVGHIRSGSKVIKEAEVWLPAQDVFAHHILIPATTGRGKSNLVKTMLWHVMDTSKVGVLVLDAHDEYFGQKGHLGLRDHPMAQSAMAYYTPSDAPPGAHHLTINLESVKPEHFEGIVKFSSAQLDAIRMAHKKFRKRWIHEIMLSDKVVDVAGKTDDPAASTRAVIQRKMKLLLSLDTDGTGRIYSKHNVFDADTKGTGTIDAIVEHIEQGMVVILDTSKLGDEAELLVGNMIASKILKKYKDAKAAGELDRKPIAAIVIEEAPRVIGEGVLTSQNDNIYATIAREGRKFKVGLVAITQLSSVIPKTILANMNTKIILGNEMKQERDALIASASQDLTEYDKSIASLDKGEAIITSIFVPFAMPVKIPLFEEMVRDRQGRAPEKIKVF